MKVYLFYKGFYCFLCNSTKNTSNNSGSFGHAMIEFSILCCTVSNDRWTVTTLDPAQYRFENVNFFKFNLIDRQESVFKDTNTVCLAIFGVNQVEPWTIVFFVACFYLLFYFIYAMSKFKECRRVFHYICLEMNKEKVCTRIKWTEVKLTF